jgi:hypothetical protein
MARNHFPFSASYRSSSAGAADFRQERLPSEQRFSGQPGIPMAPGSCRPQDRIEVECVFRDRLRGGGRDRDPVFPVRHRGRGGGDCDDWAELTCGLLLYWCWDPYIGCFESPAGDEGHAICLIRVSRVEPGFSSYAIPEGSTLNNDGVAAGSYEPVDYDVVGGITNAMGRNWKLDAILVPERIYGAAM